MSPKDAPAFDFRTNFKEHRHGFLLRSCFAGLQQYVCGPAFLASTRFDSNALLLFERRDEVFLRHRLLRRQGIQRQLDILEVDVLFRQVEEDVLVVVLPNLVIRNLYASTKPSAANSRYAMSLVCRRTREASLISRSVTRAES